MIIPCPFFLEWAFFLEIKTTGESKMKQLIHQINIKLFSTALVIFSLLLLNTPQASAANSENGNGGNFGGGNAKVEAPSQEDLSTTQLPKAGIVGDGTNNASGEVLEGTTSESVSGETVTTTEVDLNNNDGEVLEAPLADGVSMEGGGVIEQPQGENLDTEQTSETENIQPIAEEDMANENAGQAPEALTQEIPTETENVQPIAEVGTSAEVVAEQPATDQAQGEVVEAPLADGVSMEGGGVIEQPKDDNIATAPESLSAEAPTENDLVIDGSNTITEETVKNETESEQPATETNEVEAVINQSDVEKIQESLAEIAKEDPELSIEMAKEFQTNVSEGKIAIKTESSDDTQNNSDTTNSNNTEQTIVDITTEEGKAAALSMLEANAGTLSSNGIDVSKMREAIQSGNKDVLQKMFDPGNKPDGNLAKGAPEVFGKEATVPMPKEIAEMLGMAPADRNMAGPMENGPREMGNRPEFDMKGFMDGVKDAMKDRGIDERTIEIVSREMQTFEHQMGDHPENFRPDAPMVGGSGPNDPHPMGEPGQPRELGIQERPEFNQPEFSPREFVERPEFERPEFEQREPHEFDPDSYHPPQVILQPGEQQLPPLQ